MVGIRISAKTRETEGNCFINTFCVKRSQILCSLTCPKSLKSTSAKKYIYFQQFQLALYDADWEKS